MRTPSSQNDGPLIRRLNRRAAVTAGAALLAATAVALTTMGALGAFNATITQNGTFTAGSIVLKEKDPGAKECFSTGGTTPFTNNNSYSCSLIDTFGAPTGQLPGGSAVAQTLTFTNVGTSPAGSFTIVPGTCSAAGTGSYYGNATSAQFCGLVDITVGNGAAVCYYPAEGKACPTPSNTYTLETLHTNGTLTIGSGLAASGSDTIVVNTKLDTTATNSSQGLAATQGFTFTINQ